MPSVFALPLPPHQQPTAGTYIRQITKKRKRQQRWERERERETEDGKQTQSSEYSAVLAPEERSQRRLAGQLLSQEPPKRPFPHSKAPPFAGAEQKHASASTRIPNDPAERSHKSRDATLHIQHQGAITAILHKCLMAKDFSRAGRAFSLLLRDQIGGLDIDIRSEGRWAIGAEILLRRGTRSKQLSLAAGQPEQATHREDDPFYTLAGFEEAKRYYEGLIIQYPFHKLATASVNALEFYTALFGMWIFVVQEECKSTSRSGEGGSDDPPSPASSSSTLYSAKIQELEQAREIADRMDTAMSTFPYSDHVELIRLRGMTALWVADLIDFCSDYRPEEGMMDYQSEAADQFQAETTGFHPRRDISDLDVPLRAEAARSRQMAQAWFGKIRGQSSVAGSDA